MEILIGLWYAVGMLIGCATFGAQSLRSDRPLVTKYQEYLLFGVVLAPFFPLLIVAWLSRRKDTRNG